MQAWRVSSPSQQIVRFDEWQKIKMSSTNLTHVEKEKYDRDQVCAVVRKKLSHAAD